VWQAVPNGFKEMFGGMGAIYSGLAHLVRGDQPGGVTGNLAGPAGIAQVVGQVVQEATIPAWVVVFQLTAFISINLGIINLLPIPALDGGRLLFVVIEWVRRGKRVPPEREGLVHLIGMAVLLTLFVLVTFLDVQRIIDGRSILPR
jgi:regulator of sigma E protease